MKAKKSKQANLERLRVPFILMGLACSAALVLTAFEWRTFEHEELSLEDGLVITPPLEDETIFTAEVMKPPTKPKPRVMRPVVDDYVAVDDDQRIDIPLDIPIFDDEDEPVVEEFDFGAENVVEEKIFTIVEEMPEFPGGQVELLKFLSSNTKYPDMALDARIEGPVKVTFLIDEEGNISDIKAESRMGGGLKEESIRVVSIMPKWTPGKQRGKPVKVRFTLPFTYSLQ